MWDPANVSPFVAYLATADCPITGETFLVQGGVVQRVQPWTLAEKIDKGDRWTVAELAQRAGDLPSRLPLVEGAHGHPEYPDVRGVSGCASSGVGNPRRAVVPGRKVGGSHVASRARRNEQARPVPARERVRPCLRAVHGPLAPTTCSVRRRRSALLDLGGVRERGPRRPRPVTP